MKSTLNFFITTFVALILFAPLVHAQKAKPKPKAKPAAAKVDTEAEIKALLGEYKMGMSKAEVTVKLKAEIEKNYSDLMDKERTATAKDEVRRRKGVALGKIKQNTVNFDGKVSGWNTSIIDDMFALKNNESMIARLDSDQQKFFFFYNDKLYKVFIALAADQYAGYNFPKFQAVIETVYGKAQEEFEVGITGDSELHHLLWKTSGSLHLWAMDKTGVYGNFVLIVVDNDVHTEVLAARKERGLNVAGYMDLGINPIVKATGKTLPEPEKAPEPPKDSMKPPRKGRK